MIYKSLYEKHEYDLKADFNYVYAKQGKSVNYHIWCLKDLLKSNCQLNEVDQNVLNDKIHYNVHSNELSNIAISINMNK